jgi:hypothetical protein
VIRVLRSVPGRLGSFTLAHYSPSGLLLAGVLLLDAILVLSGVVLDHYFSKDVVTSLTQFPADTHVCEPTTEGLGNHCFADYGFVRLLAPLPNPWDAYNGSYFNYPAAGLLPLLGPYAIGLLSGSLRVGLFVYVALLFAGLSIPAWWASAGKSIGIRILIIGAFGALSAPALMALDRGNSVGFLAPVLLLLFVSLRRANDTGVVVAIVLAVIIKPQFVALFLLFLLMRKWKAGAIALLAVAITNFAAYLFWPADFPSTIPQTLGNIARYGSGVSLFGEFPANVSFAESFHQIELLLRPVFGMTTESTWSDNHQGIFGPVILAALAVALIVLGKRIPIVLAAFMLSAAVSMLTGISWSYYLVFALPIAAVLLRDPLDRAPSRTSWHGFLDASSRDRPQVIATVALVVATAATVSRVLFFSTAHVPGTEIDNLVKTSGEWTPLLWLAAIVLVLVAWGRHPEPESGGTRASSDALPSPASPAR